MRTSFVRLAVLPAALLAFAAAAPAGAQTIIARTRVLPAPPTSAELRRFDDFLDRHPLIDDELIRNPRLADDQGWLAHNARFAQYLAVHPGIRAELRANPGYFTWRTERRERGEPETRAELARFDAFLDMHPAIERELDRNPRLVDDPRFVAAHPELRDYLKTHPRLSGDLLAKPWRTMGNEHRIDRY